MRLARLEMHGFKSFADRTEIVFEPGVTAIVGPNGCGKSNVSDAVRWVLGEQRARLLRGAKMEEVIFQGSSARRAVNIAEVSLFFENDDGALPVAFREVVITRRLSRSGESDYLLNRSPCRLRDIHDLLRGTGLGADTGVVIEAKMIDALLSDRPDDRRELFEEAAGVGLYRDRRRSTERRLEETAGDLARLDDLLTEVQSQVRSLSRQRRRAERYTELRTRRFAVELTLAAREMEAWREELARLDARVAELRHEVPAAHVRVSDAERARDDAHAGRAAAESARTELARLLSEEQQTLLRLESEIRVAEERQRNATARRVRAEEERRQEEALEMQLAAGRAAAAQERESVEQDFARAQATLRERERAEEMARGAVSAARRAHDEMEARMRALRDAAHELELDRQGALRELEELEQRSTALAAEGEQLTEARERAGSELALAGRSVDAAGHDATRAAEQLTAARVHAESARQADAATRSELFRAEELCTSLHGRVTALEALERERVGLAPAAARLLRERERFGDGAILGPLSDFIAASARPAASIERFLGSTLNAVLVRDRRAADAVRAWHADANPGPLLLLPLDAPPHTQPDATAEGLSSTAEIAEPAGAWVRTLLGQVHALAEGTAFLDANGAVWLPGSTAGPGPLRRRAELTALRGELDAAQQERAEISGRADAARAEFEASDGAIAGAAAAEAEARQRLRAAEEQRDEIGRHLQRIERDLSGVDAQAERLSTRRRELLEKARAVEEAQAAHARLSDAAQEDVAASRATLEAAERSLEAARDDRTRAQVSEAQLQARLQVAADRERRLSDEASTAVARLHVLATELSEIADADGMLAQHLASWEMERESRGAAVSDATVRLDAAERAVRDANATLERVEHALDAARDSSTALADELHHAELRLSDLSGRRTAIRERLEAEWRQPLEVMLQSVTPVEADADELRAELDTLRGELDGIGPVNALAVEEHEEELKRLDFLTSQRADLADARTSLQQAIREINATARELFLATFAQVRENFRQIFLTLFGGGECDIALQDPDAPLDCDIEIRASPRGKRTQRIHLLSSGERALVALSLLFGIFLTKPSPFCLLDEVDAPLDDQNVGRFVRMLNEFKSNTQFIVITHNPRTTTEAADAVYGVTMQEPGVSSFVSVRMRGRTVDEAELSVQQPVTPLADQRPEVDETSEAHEAFTARP